MQPASPTPTPTHVPTIQELIQAKLIKNANPATASDETVLASADVAMGAGLLGMGGQKGILTLSRRSLSFQPTSTGPAIEMPVDSVMMAKIHGVHMSVTAQQQYDFVIKKQHQVSANATPGAPALAWATLLKQLQPNVIIKVGKRNTKLTIIMATAVLLIVLLGLAYAFNRVSPQ